MNQKTNEVSFVADSVTNKVYAFYQRKSIVGPSGFYGGFTAWYDATVYAIDDSTNTATSTGVVASGTDLDLPSGNTQKILKFFWIVSGNLYYGTGNKLLRYSLTDLESKNEIALPLGTSNGYTLLARKQYMYITSKNGLARYNYKTGELELVFDSFGSNDPGTTYVDRNERYAYLDGGNWVMIIDLQTKQIHTLANNRQINTKLFGGLMLGKRECLFLKNRLGNLLVWDTSYHGPWLFFDAGNGGVFGYTSVSETIYLAFAALHNIEVSMYRDFGVHALFTVTTNETRYFECIKLAVQGNSLYLSTEQSLYVYDLTTFAGQAIIVDNTSTNNTMFSCSSTMLFPGGSYMYWSNLLTGRLYKIDIASRAPVEWIEDPRALAFSAVVAPNATIYFGGSTSNYGVIETGETNSLFDDPPIATNATRIPSTTYNTKANTSSSVVPHFLVLALVILMAL
jgi:hypothetical protein